MRTWTSLAAAVLLSTWGATATADTHAVEIAGFSFDPPELTIAVGDSVVWTNEDSAVHTVTSGVDCTPDGYFDSGDIGSGNAWGYAFTATGEYPYYCLYHCPQMEGRITVLEPTPAVEPTWAQIKALFQ